MQVTLLSIRRNVKKKWNRTDIKHGFNINSKFKLLSQNGNYSI